MSSELERAAFLIHLHATIVANPQQIKKPHKSPPEPIAGAIDSTYIDGMTTLMHILDLSPALRPINDQLMIAAIVVAKSFIKKAR